MYQKCSHIMKISILMRKHNSCIITFVNSRYNQYFISESNQFFNENLSVYIQEAYWTNLVSSFPVFQFMYTLIKNNQNFVFYILPL
jgi:hypothetical protein